MTNAVYVFQLDDSGDSEKQMIGDDSSGPNALDLNSLLKNLESEILLNEQNLNDENDKRYMFKVTTANEWQPRKFRIQYQCSYR